MQIQAYYHKCGLDLAICQLDAALARSAWTVVYRDWRKLAQIACNHNCELLRFRGFGCVKRDYPRGPVVSRRDCEFLGCTEH